MFGRKQRARLAQLERQNAALVEALRWYANREHWLRKATNEPGQPLTWEKSRAAHDRGERARQGLAFAHIVTTHPAPDAEERRRLPDAVTLAKSGKTHETAVYLSKPGKTYSATVPAPRATADTADTE